MLLGVAGGGFEEWSSRIESCSTSEADRTEAGVAWFADHERARARSASSQALGLHLVMGPDFGVMTGNLGRNLREGRVALVQAVVVKP